MLGATTIRSLADSDADCLDVSFVVIAYNEAANVAKCLSSITSQTGAGSFEVIVVDDASSDATASVVAAVATSHPEITLVQHPVNRGRGAARHTGLGVARGALVAMVDADVVLPEDWLERCRAAMDTEGADAVGGVPVPDGDVTFLCGRFALRPRPVRPTIPVAGSNGLYRRQVFELLMVDPALTEGEDVAFNRAMEAAGMRTRTVEGIIVRHCGNKGFAQSLRWLYQSGQGATRQLARYGEIRSPDVAFAGQLAAVAAGVAATRLGSFRRHAWVLPGGYLLAVSGAHMARKFEIRGSLFRFALATATNAVFLGGYFAGRIMGVPAILRHSPGEVSNG